MKMCFCVCFAKRRVAHSHGTCEIPLQIVSPVSSSDIPHALIPQIKGVLLRDQKPTMGDVLNPAMTVPSTCRYLKLWINDSVVYLMTCKRVLRSVSLSETPHIAHSH